MIDAIRAHAHILAGAVDRPSAGITRRLDALVPEFRARVELVLADMRAAGHDPLVWETYRTPDRAAYLAGIGRGVRESMHCYGLAVDVISDGRKWSPHRAFWRDLRRLAVARGLVSGAAFSRVDLPHIQAVPVALQPLVRAAATPDDVRAIAVRALA